MSNYKSTYIKAVGYAVPENKLTHAELQERFGAEQMNKVAESSGIVERRVVDKNTCASDLAFMAADSLLEKNNIDRSSIDVLIFASQTPDYLLPTTACILQNRLKLKTQCAAFDINLGCSQYLYSLATAHSMLVAGLGKRALVLTGDTVSRIIHSQDKSVVPLFGDAGSATILDVTDKPNTGFIGFELGTDGNGHQHLIWPTSGMRLPRTPESAEIKPDSLGNMRSEDHMKMDGKAVFIFTLTLVPQMISRLMTKVDMKVEDIDIFVFHQASKLIVDSIAKKLKIPEEKIVYKLSHYGNSGGSTVAVALTEAHKNGRIKPGMKVLMAAFGVGLSWGATMLVWPEDGGGIPVEIGAE